MRFKGISSQFLLLEPQAISKQASCQGEKVKIGRKTLNLIQMNQKLEVISVLDAFLSF